MDWQQIKKRLQMLNAARLGRSRVQGARDGAFAPAGEPNVIVPPSPAGGTPTAGPLPIENIAPGRVIRRADGGTYWLIERRLTEMAPHCKSFVRRYGQLLTSEAIILPDGARRELAEFVECDPLRVVYLDLETTGLAGEPLFLVGLMEFDGTDFAIKQFFARNYAEEFHVLADVADYLARFEMLVTFNGRSFDVPYMSHRAIVNQLHFQAPRRHFDLLHEARRRWRDLLPNCKLVTLEEFICRRRRIGDIPSELIPEAYHRFVHTEDASEMRHVIHHNALDLLTMAELALFMLTGRKDWD